MRNCDDPTRIKANPSKSDLIKPNQTKSEYSQRRILARLAPIENEGCPGDQPGRRTRQRIGIARGFLKDESILLLDEPTSALDPPTEHAIMETMKELMAGCRIGAGAELLARHGVYAALYRSANIQQNT